jgi:hypothetical protein
MTAKAESAETFDSDSSTFDELRALAKTRGLTLLKQSPPGCDPQYLLRNGTTVNVYVETDLGLMATHIAALATTPAEDATTEVAAQETSEPVAVVVPETVEPADLDAVEDIDGTWVIAREASDGTTYWAQDGGYSLLIRQGVAMWPNKHAAAVAVREALGSLPRNHKAIQLTDAQAEMVESPYRVIQGELVADPPKEFSEMELPELAAAADGWMRVANVRAAQADNVMATALEAAVYAGAALIMAKAQCKERGEKWLLWLEANWRGTPRKAQYYMAVAKKRNGVSHLDFDQSLRGAIKQITSKKPDDEPDKKPNPSDAAAKKAGAKATRKAKAINEAATLIAELKRMVAKDLTQHTFTAADADTITKQMIDPLREISLNLQSLAKTAELIT